MRDAGIPDWEMGKGVSSADAIRLIARQRDEALATIARIETWTHEFGSALCPPGPDSYGEGMRDVKAQVAKLLTRQEPTR